MICDELGSPLRSPVVSKPPRLSHATPIGACRSVLLTPSDRGATVSVRHPARRLRRTSHQRGEHPKCEDEVPMNESPRRPPLELSRSLVFSLFLLICICPAVPAR